MLRTERARSAAIAVFAAGLTCAAVVLLAVPLADTPAPASLPRVPWWVLVPLFAAAEVVVVHVQLRRESLSVSFAEIPLIIGLVTADPEIFVAASVLGSGIGLLGRRQFGLKLFFNLSMFAAEAALAQLLYHVLLGDADPLGTRGLLAALVTIVATDLFTAAALTAVLWLKLGEFDEGVLSEAVSTGLVAALTNASVGLLAVVLLDSRPAALGLLLVVVATLVLAYRGYSSLSRGHARLEGLYRFTRGVNGEVRAEAVSEAVLRQARDVLAAETALLIVLPTEGVPGSELRLAGNRLERRTAPRTGWWAPVLAGTSLHQRTDADDGLTGQVDRMAAPITVDGAVVAVLAVEERPSHLEGFGEADLKLFESLANHAGVSLHKATLVDRLRDEASNQEHRALHDTVTGLPNRRHALLGLASELTQSGSCGVLVVDLDGFTDVNEALGHDHGDDLLREVGSRLSVFAEFPGQVARLGNDEFCVLLYDVVDEDDGRRRADAVIALLAAPFRIGGNTVLIGTNAGLALTGPGTADATRLLQEADAALYAAKRDRVALRTWDLGARGRSVRRLAVISGLRAALTGGTLEVHYQPKVEPRTGRPVGAEALVRWTDPGLGRVGPDEFIPLAEHAGLIGPLTDVVLRTAVRDCVRWRSLGHTFGVAVNLSPRSLVDPELPGQVGEVLAAAGLPPAALTLEITETAVMADLSRSLVVLHALRAMGVRLSVDDFGTGQSSLSYLQHLPVHEMKVDRTFVQGLHTSRGDAAIAQAAVSLGHALGLQVVAEGVEDAPTQELLAEWGCDVVQGFHIARPMPAAAFGDWLGARADHGAITLGATVDG